MNSKKNGWIYNIISFMLLFAPFNFSIVKIFPDLIQIVLYSFPFISILFLTFDYIKSKKETKKFDKIEIGYLSFILIALLFIIRKNGSISNNTYLTFLLTIIYLPLPLYCYKSEKLINSLFSVLKIFVMEHLIGVVFELLFRGLYLDLWVNLFTGDVHTSLTLWYEYGFLVGFTTNYTITGIYISIGIMYFFSKLMSSNSKNKKIYNIIILGIFLVMALIIGKRGTLLFSLFACFFVYLIGKQKKSNGKLFKLLFVLSIIAIVFFIISQFFPSILNTLLRFENLTKDSTFENRKNLYKYALTFWKNNILFGNGWKTFAYYYKFYQPAYLTGYFDVHNVYLQLLCETGIIGLVFFAYNMFKSLIQTIKIFLKNISVNREILYFSTIYQIFFVLYCLSENPLYDIQCSVIYLFSIGIYLTLLPSLKKYNMKGKKIYEEK